VKRHDRPPTHASRPPRTLLPTIGTAAVVGVSLVLAACGGSSSSSNGSAGASNRSTKQENSRLKFTQCMREHGVNFSDTGGAPTGLQNTPQTTLQAAFSACRKYATGTLGSAASSSSQSEVNDRLVKYASCLRQAGLSISDPTGSGTAALGEFFKQLQGARQNPNFEQANAKCQADLPQGGPFAGAGAGG
jgi:hypothetical protein